MTKHCLGLLLALTLCGCASDRMMSSSPFGAKDAAKAAEPIKNSVNVWPLAYQSGDNLSVMWPMYDQDPNGFSVRPLFVKDKDFYGIVPPVCGCKNGKGWFLSLYNTENNFGFAPLFNYGDKFNYYGPAWFDGDEYGFFPVFWGGKDYHTVPPLYYCSDGKGWFANVYNTQNNFGVFPVFNYGKNFSYYGPAWCSGDEYGFFPVFWAGKDYHTVPPLYYCSDGKGWFANVYNTENNFGAFPIFNRGKDFSYYGPVWIWDNQYGVFPVASLGGEYQAICPVVWGPDMVFFPGGYFSSKFNLLTLAWWEYQDDSVNEWGFFPLIHWSPEFKNVLNYWQSKDNVGVFPLFVVGNDLNHVTLAWWQGDEYGFFPMFWGGKDYSTLQPLYYYRSDDRSSTLNLSWLLYHGKSAYQVETKELESSDNMFLLFGVYDVNRPLDTVELGYWPLFKYSNMEEDQTPYLLHISQNRTGVVAPFVFEYANSKDALALPRESEASKPLGFGYAKAPKARIAATEINFLLLLYRQEQSVYREWAPDKNQQSLNKLVDLLPKVTTVPYQDIAPGKRTPEQQKAVEKSTREREKELAEIRSLLNGLGLPDNVALETSEDRLAVEKQLIAFTVEKQYSSYFTPLGWSNRYGNDQTAAALWPLFLYVKNGDKEVRGIFFCFTVDEQKPDALPTQNECSHPIDTAFCSAPKAYVASDKINFMGFLFHHNLTTYREWDAAKGPDKLQQLLTQLRQVAPIAYDNIAENQRTEKQQQAFAASIQKRQEQLDKIRQLLKEIGLSENAPLETAEDRQTIEKQLIAFTVQKEYCSYFTPLFWSLRYGDDQKIAVLWPFYRYSKNGDRVDQSILQYFYRQQGDGAVSQTDIFPFLSIYETKDKYQFSWVWQMFRYERDGDQTKYWLFFIPLQ